MPEPLVESVMVTTPSLVDILDQGLGNADVQKVIDGVLAGEVALPWVMPSTLHQLCGQCGLVFTSEGDGVYLLPKEAVTLGLKSVDPSGRIFSLVYS